MASFCWATALLKRWQLIIIPSKHHCRIFRTRIYGISQVIHLSYPRPKSCQFDVLRLNTSALPEAPYTVYVGLHFLAPSNRRFLNAEVSEAVDKGIPKG